jgi:hypothetical protein
MSFFHKVILMFFETPTFSAAGFCICQNRPLAGLLNSSRETFYSVIPSVKATTPPLMKTQTMNKTLFASLLVSLGGVLAQG